MEREDSNNNIVAHSMVGHKEKGVAQWTYCIYRLTEKKTQFTVITGDRETPCG